MVVAPIVAIENLFGKYALLTLDDSSGETLAVKIHRLPPDQGLSETDLPSNTTVSNVNIDSPIGKFEVRIDGETVDIGTVIRVKCTITTFRGKNQLDLQRASIIRTTKKESLAWEEVARWKRIISKPWTLSVRELRRFENDQKEAREKEQKACIIREEKLRKRRERARQRDQEAEMKRVKVEARMNQGALI